MGIDQRGARGHVSFISLQWVAILSLGLGIGCGGEPIPVQPPDSFPRWGMEMVGDALDSEPPLDLTYVRDLMEDDGDLLIVQPRPAEVLRVRSGAPAQLIGRVGEGPGEYQLPHAVQVLGDTVWIADASARRLLGYLDDEPVVTISMPSPPFPPEVVPVGLFAEGPILMQPRGISIYGALDGTVTEYPYYSVARTGLLLDTIYKQPVLPEDFYRGSPPTDRVGAGSMPVMKSPTTVLLRDGRGLVVVEREPALADTVSAYRVRLFDPRGTELDRIEVRYDPLPSGPGMEAFLEERRERLLAADYSAEDLAASLNGVRKGFDAAFPFLPPVTGLKATSSGRVWVKRETLGQDSVRWDLFESENARVEAHVILPSAFSVIENREDRVWAVRLDEFDVPHIVEFRLLR